MTKIQWTNETWNPIVGCQKVSPGCDNCYAEKMANRLANISSTEYYKNVIISNKWNGNQHLVESALEKPLKWKKPRMIFVCSMADLFKAPFEWIDKVFEIISLSPGHTYQILTKRPGRALKYFKWHGEKIRDEGLDSIPSQSDNPLDYVGVLPNVWIGVTAENQEQLEKRVPVLLKIPAKIRFVSCEPLLGPIKFAIKGYDMYYGFLSGLFSSIDIPYPSIENKLDWVIVGGETGSKARPMHYPWVKYIQKQCRKAKTPFFFKSWGEYIPSGYKGLDDKGMAYINLTPGKDEILVSEKGYLGNMVKSKNYKEFKYVLDGKECKQFP